MDDQAWDDADVERFLARLGECGIRPFLIEGSETEDPKDAVDFDPPDGAGFDPVIALVFLGHRRDLACWLRGLRGEARKAAVADARAEARRQLAPPGGWPRRRRAQISGLAASRSTRFPMTTTGGCRNDDERDDRQDRVSASEDQRLHPLALPHLRRRDGKGADPLRERRRDEGRVAHLRTLPQLPGF